MSAIRNFLQGIFWLFVGLFIGLFICNSRAEDWANPDRLLFATYLTASAIDAAQTIDALDRRWPDGRPMYEEVNPFLGDNPSDAAIIGTKLASAAAIWFIADRFPTKRRAILWVATAIQVSVTAHNASIGMRVNW